MDEPTDVLKNEMKEVVKTIAENEIESKSVTEDLGKAQTMRNNDPDNSVRHR